MVVVGTTEEVESEGFDRDSLALPGRQDELVRRVADANPDTIVVVNAGAPVLLPWADSVAAVILAWFPGQEFGNALADVLLGDAEPGGRLPTTLAAAARRASRATQPVDGVLRYDEGLLVGYRGYERGGPAPLYPFGHGLGYSSWTYLSIDAPRQARAGADVAVDVTVRNTGDAPRPGGGPAVCQPRGQRGAATRAVAGRVCGGGRQRRRGRDRDDQRARAGVPALELGRRRLDDRARRLPARRGRLLDGALAVFAQSRSSEGIPRQRATGVRRLTSPLRGGHRAFHTRA